MRKRRKCETETCSFVITVNSYGVRRSPPIDTLLKINKGQIMVCFLCLFENDNRNEHDKRDGKHKRNYINKKNSYSICEAKLICTSNYKVQRDHKRYHVL